MENGAYLGGYNDNLKVPEIITRLSLLQEKVYQLRDKLNPVLVSNPRTVDSVQENSSSQVMKFINTLIEEVSDIKDSIDIN